MNKLAAVAVLLLLPLGSAQFPSHDDVVSRLDAAAAAAPDWIEILDVGASGEDRMLGLAVVTDPDSPIPMADRVVTLLLTQQHGNEPAGTPAVLALLEAIAAGEPIRDTLHNQILLVQPMGNPDGATANQRENAAGSDLNRDHVHLAQPETQIVHQLFQDWDIHVGVDHHEYSGTGLGSPVPVRTYDYDATVLYPRHGNVRPGTVDAARDLMHEGMMPAAEEAGYSIGDYGTLTASGIPVDHLAGGPDPGILRNNFGLNNIAGLLVESFVPTGFNPTIDAERRTDVHRVIMEGTLQYVSDNAQMFRDAKRAAEQLNLDAPWTEYIQEWPDHPVTGEANPANIRAPMGLAYATAAAVDDVMALHGLPAHGWQTDNAFAYDLVNERSGLLAAMLHPASTRAIAPATETEHSQTAEAAESEPAAAPSLVLLLALLGTILVVRRKTT